MGFSYNFGPLSKMDDGYMDILLARRRNIGRIGIARLLTDEDEGYYFDDNGDPRPEIGIEYYKVTEFNLKPRAKGVPPQKKS